MDATQLHSTDGPSRVCLGTDSFGSRAPPATAWQLLDQFVEADGIWADTANAYAWWAPGRGGESERAVGSWLARRPRSCVGSAPRRSTSPTATTRDWRCPRS